MSIATGPDFDFSGRHIPVDMKIPTVEEAQAELDAHLVRFPGDYFYCYEHNRLFERREWLIRRESLERNLERAKLYQGARPAPKRQLQMRRRENVSGKAKDRQSAEDYAATARAKVAAMAQHEPGSLPWRKLRASVADLAWRARRRAKEDGQPEPEIPPTPHLSDWDRIPPGCRGGRPRSENPSPAALQKRKERASKVVA